MAKAPRRKAVSSPKTKPAKINKSIKTKKPVQIKKSLSLPSYPEGDFRALFLAMKQGVVYQDADGKIISANPAAERLLGLSIDQMQGRTSLDPHWRTIHEDGSDFPGKTHPAMVALRTGQEVSDAVMGVFNPTRKDFTWILVNAFPQFRPGETKPFQVMATFVAITELRTAERVLGQSQRLLTSLLSAVPDLLIVVDRDFRIQYTNYKGHDRIESPQDPDLAKHCYGRFKHLKEPCEDCSARSVFENGRIVEQEMVNPADGRIRELRAFPIFDVEGRVEMVVEHVRDIDDRKRTEDALKKSEEELRTMLEQLVDVLYVTDEAGLISHISPSVRNVFGWDPEEMIGHPFVDFLPEEEVPFALEKFQEAIGQGQLQQNLNLVMKRRDGGTFYGELNGSLLQKDGRIFGMIGLIRDVTDRRQTEMDLRSALHEKEVLLREIHHRVKNNMQVISSLLNLQSAQVEDPVIKAMFRDSQFRIRSMALVHESLYRSASLSQIDFSEYIRKLFSHLSQALGVSENRVAARFDFEEIFLDINTAIPLGLIVSELVTNAMKHAFPWGRQGEIRLELHRAEMGEGWVLIVADDGVGFPRSLDYQTTDSLGLQIVRLLVDQLDAKIELMKEPGTCFRLAFREVKYPKRI